MAMKLRVKRTGDVCEFSKLTELPLHADLSDYNDVLSKAEQQKDKLKTLHVSDVVDRVNKHREKFEVGMKKLRDEDFIPF